jgi:enoyl-CoA hydratase/carnithine racemase
METLAIDTGTDELLCHLQDRVAVVTLNRPEQRNALSDNLTPALRAILLELETDTRVGCVMITGAGTAFCAGGDVSGMGSGGSRSNPVDRPPPSLEDGVRALQHKQETLTIRLHQLAKPTLAALPGPAAGAGLSIALACDIRVASRSAFITTAFRNIGLSGDYGSSWLLTQLVGTARAKELFYTARRVPAEECERLGIVNQVFDDEEFRERSMELAREIADGPPIALRYMKENLNRALVADLKTCLDMEADRMVRCTRTEDHREAVSAFLAKRTPRFEGK